jgi:hypothetical protein
VTAYTAEQIARVVHAANAELQKVDGDPAPSLPWDTETDEIRESAAAGVRAALAGATPEQLHEEWCRVKTAQGWTYGTEKDARLKTHPCLVYYEKLPENQRAKDDVFTAIVRAMTGDGGLEADDETPGYWQVRSALASAVCALNCVADGDHPGLAALAKEVLAKVDAAMADDPFGASAFRGHSPGCICPDCEGAREDAASTAGDDFVQDRHADLDPGEGGGMPDSEFYDRTSGAGQ